MKKIQIYASLLGGDLENIDKEIKRAKSADSIHWDVMDGKFVPNKSFSLADIAFHMSKNPNTAFDIHLMVSDPKEYIEEWRKLSHGNDYLQMTQLNLITIHIESFNSSKECIDCLKMIRESVYSDIDISAGIAISPRTELNCLTEELLDNLDSITIMTVEPGFAGQKFLTSQIEKISQARLIIDQHCDDCRIFLSVDGGINLETGKIAVDNGADVLISGGFIFKNPDIDGSIEMLKKLMN